MISFGGRLLEVGSQRLTALFGLDSVFRTTANHLGADRHACFRVEWLDGAVGGTAIVNLHATHSAACIAVENTRLAALPASAPG